MMQPDEYEALVEDIRANGLLEPIWTYEDSIIDGRNRWRACQEASVAPTFREWGGQGSLVAFVVSLNLKRRHLDSGQRAVLALKIEKQLAVEAKGRQATSAPGVYGGEPLSQKIEQAVLGRASEQAAAIVGTNRQYVSDAKRIERTAPELLPLVSNRTLSFQDAKKLSKDSEETREKVLERIATGEAKNVREAKGQVKKETQIKKANGHDDSLPPSVEILTGDFRVVASRIPDNSVDLIFTDPPYDRDSVSLYADLAILGARVLKPGGSLITYAGHYALPEILALMVPHLRYWWIIAMNHSGASARLPGKWVYVEWKPLLWFVKEYRAGKGYVADRVDSRSTDKEHHEWQQDTSEGQYYIEHLCPVGGTVLDPFLGGGTTGVASLALGRRFVGIEVDVNQVAIAKMRLSNARHEVSQPI